MMDKWKHIREQLECYKTSFEFVNNIAEVAKNHPFDFDSLSKGQLYSKIWLINELKKITPNAGNVYLLCGWYGILAEMLFKNITVNNIKSFDLDSLCTVIADELNISNVINNWRFKSFVANVNTIEYEDVDTVINTSCEHLGNNSWFINIPNETLVVLQSNNSPELTSDHVNCVSSLEEMKSKYKLFKILYEGELDLLDYKRFMLIGVK